MSRLKDIFVRLVDNLYGKLHAYEELPPLDAQLGEVMRNFDFDRVATFMSWDKSVRVYDDNDVCIREEPWKMFNHETATYSVPTTSELKTFAHLLLSQVIELYEPNNLDRQVVWMGSGPFKAVCRYGILELMCVITCYSYD